MDTHLKVYFLEGAAFLVREAYFVRLVALLTCHITNALCFDRDSIVTRSYYGCGLARRES